MPQAPITHEAFTRAFRDTLGMFATGIAVVATRAANGDPIGLTVNSFNSVSLDPPLIVWSMARHLPSLSVFEACEYYSVNVLAADQEHLSQLFASRADDKFAGIDIDEGLYGVPLLRDCCARFECRNITRHPGGDHLVFLSEVVRFDREERPPLIFHGGAYRGLAPL
ncbi:MAG TPA: flavin reductase family protein [Rhodocyclaceae bacterium]|nr:flavin reductase family protein [Rhodocyclaceae bacterium]HRQ47534.1 flavin reductase family protein [Rhodocyclaceae bacterium]